MIDPLYGIGPEAIGRTEGPGRETARGGPPGAPSFKTVLADAMNEVNRLQQDAEVAITRLQTGEAADLTQVMVAVEKADLAFKTLMQIRNKLLDAYRQIEEMRI